MDVREVSYEEGGVLFDKRARRLFGISGAEWLRRYDAGELDNADHSKVVTMEMLIPFVRSVPA
jgi:hypothetical protein